MRRASTLAAPWLLAAALLLAWEAGCRLTHTPTYFLPPPSQVAVALWRHFPALLGAAWRTLGEALAALLIAGLVALGLALVVAMSEHADRAVRPLASVIQVTPVVALAPLFQIWAGLEHPGRALVALAVLVAFFPIFSGAASGLQATDPDLDRLFALYGASRWQRLWRLQAPSAIPFVLQGLKVGAGLAIIGAVVAEFGAGSGTTRGLAWEIVDAGNKVQTDRMIAALVVLGVLGVALHAAFEAAERAALRWWRGR